MRLATLVVIAACTASWLVEGARAEPPVQHDDGLFTGDPVALGRGVQARAPQVIYRYTRPDGREAFTNILDNVPEAQRPSAPMDLSHVTLNSELGRELQRRLGAEHAALASTEHCEDARAEAGRSFFEVLWQQYAPLVVCGALMVLFILFTPAALKRMSAPSWARTLTMAIPTLALAGLISFSMMRTNQTLSQVRAFASSCDADTFQKLARGDNPIVKQAALVSYLRDQVQGLDAIGASGGRTEQRGTRD